MQSKQFIGNKAGISRGLKVPSYIVHTGKAIDNLLNSQ